MSASPPGHAAPLRFGPEGRFELQAAERRLLIDGQSAALGARALDLLIALAAQPDQLVSKGELLDRVWPGLVVEEANLQMQVSNLRKLLGGDIIATVPGRGYRFVAALRSADTPPGTKPSPQPPTPTAAARLFGRDADRHRLEAMLRAGVGCVSLVGTSGVGKTSLARAVCAGWPGRTVWVDLAALTDGGQVTAALARALGTALDHNSLAEQLPRALKDQVLLLVLDNAEHLINTCAALATLLLPLAGVHLLVTSQLPLAVAAERVQRLEPLALPTADDAQALADGAMALLVERIIASDQRFSVSPAAMPVLRSICTQLDGLPLALEMAAARVPLLGLRGVQDALAQRFALLTRGHRDAAQRHRTLHHALDWSYRLLSTEEQRLFRALGVFSGGFTLDLAVNLMTDDPQARWDVIEQLSALVDRSLVVVSAQDPPRYHLLETMRAFAIEQLCQAPATSAEQPLIQRHHAEVMLALFSRYQMDDRVARALCEAEMANVREAIQWAQTHDLGLAAQLSSLAAQVGNFTAWRPESAQWLRALEAQMDHALGEALPTAVQAAWWTEFARIGSIRRDPQSAVAARRALALWDAVGDRRRALFAACVSVRSVCKPGPDLDRACDDLQARFDAAPDLTLRERLAVNGALAVAATEREDLEAILSGRLDEIDLARQLGLDAVVDGAE
jgi:predicted ATPase/DNA-binding winged helix-turn-helix (wHTH) protein